MIRTSTIPPFIAELRAAAGDAERLGTSELKRLLSRAAATIREYRYEINLSDAPANDDGPNDIATHLAGVAANLDEVPDTAVSKLLVQAADNIDALRILLEEKLKLIAEQDLPVIPGIPSEFVEDSRHMVQHAELFSKDEVLVMLGAAADMIEMLAENAGTLRLADIEPEGNA